MINSFIAHAYSVVFFSVTAIEHGDYKLSKCHTTAKGVSIINVQPSPEPFFMQVGGRVWEQD